MSDRSALNGLLPSADRGSGSARSTEEVLHSHLEHRSAGDLAGDLEENYHPEVVLLSAEGVHRGHHGVRRLDGILHHYVGEGQWTAIRLEVEDKMGFLEWRSDGGKRQVHDGADSFVVADGKIVAQTIHYSSGPS
jgi:hypothetical protein